MSYEANVKKRGLVEFDRTPGGMPKEKGSVHELAIGEQRALLVEAANVLHFYAAAVSELTPQQSDKPDDNVYARIESDVHKAAINEKASRLSAHAKGIYQESRGGNISRISQLLSDQCFLLAERLGEPKATHQEMAATWVMINEFIKSNRIKPEELQMRLLAIFDSPELGSRFVGEMEMEIRSLLTKLKRFSDRLAKMATLGEGTEDAQYHQGYKNVAKLFRDNLQSPERASLMALMKNAAAKIKDLERNNNPVLLGLPDLELVRYLTADTEATGAK